MRKYTVTKQKNTGFGKSYWMFKVVTNKCHVEVDCSRNIAHTFTGHGRTLAQAIMNAYKEKGRYRLTTENECQIFGYVDILDETFNHFKRLDQG